MDFLKKLSQKLQAKKYKIYLEWWAFNGHVITVKIIHSFNINFKANLALYQTLWHM